MSEPDLIDLKILDLLQRHGRMSVTEIGEQVGLSTSPCSERIKRLERKGLITGYHARLDPVQLGRSLLVFIEITLSQKSQQIFEKIRREVGLMPEVLECHHVSGNDSYVMQVVARDLPDLERFLADVNAWGETRTSIVFSTPIPPAPKPGQFALATESPG